MENCANAKHNQVDNVHMNKHKHTTHMTDITKRHGFETPHTHTRQICFCFSLSLFLLQLCSFLIPTVLPDFLFFTNLFCLFFGFSNIVVVFQCCLFFFCILCIFFHFMFHFLLFLVFLHCTVHRLMTRTPFDSLKAQDLWTTMAEDAMRALQQQFKLNWRRADRRQASLQHSGRKYELHSAGHRRWESVWTHGCWESQAISRVLKTLGETGVQCSWVTLAQRCHDCRSWNAGTTDVHPVTLTSGRNDGTKSQPGSVRSPPTNGTVARPWMKSRVQRFCSGCPNHN